MLSETELSFSSSESIESHSDETNGFGLLLKKNLKIRTKEDVLNNKKLT